MTSQKSLAGTRARSSSASRTGNLRAQINRIHTPCFWVCLLFALALIVRGLGLNVFLNLDEWTWLDRTRTFHFVLQAQHWENTFLTGHPGITTLWSGQIGLWLFRVHQGISPSQLDELLFSMDWSSAGQFYPYVRLPIVIVSAGSVSAVYWLMARLFRPLIGVFAGLLFLLEPLYVGHSRALHHDALMSTWMTLTALTLLLHIQQTPATAPTSRLHLGWLLLSGIFGGLALLSKTLSLFLLPWMVAVLGLAWLLGRLSLREALGGIVLWLFMAGWTIYLLWPAMWIEPLRVIQRVIGLLFTYSETPHALGQFFLGQMIDDPGWGFYPVVLLFALTPLVMVGLGWQLGIVTWHSMKRRPLNEHWETTSLLFLFAVAYMVAISLGEKKQDRYLLPTVLMLNLLASVGLGALWQWRGRHQQKQFGGLGWGANVVIALLLLQCWFTVDNFPHYLTYANPLVGGNRARSNQLLVGGGEGNELAAHYLNSLPGAADRKVVASKAATFAPFFHGRTEYWNPLATVLGMDYVVMYKSDLQRGQPDPAYVQLVTQWPLVYVGELHGVDYVHVYQVPRANWYLQAFDVQERSRYLGLEGSRLDRETNQLYAGDALTLTLTIRNREDATGEWVVEWRDEGGKSLGQVRQPSQTPPPQDNPILTTSTFYRLDFVLPTAVHWPPGPYTLAIGWQGSRQSQIQWLPPDTFLVLSILFPPASQ